MGRSRQRRAKRPGRAEAPRGHGGPASGAAALGALPTLNAELDALLLQLLLDLEHLEGKRAALNARVEEGWLSLSKSRYAMGVKAVGPLQYGSSMAALFRVGISEPEPGRPEFQVMFTDPKEAQGLMEPKAEVPFPPVRRRRTQPQPTCPEPAPLALPKRDPLTWFGILVPQSLRQAQGSFRAALLMAGEVAGLQSRIEWGRGQIQILLQEKRKLLDQLKVA